MKKNSPRKTEGTREWSSIWAAKSKGTPAHILFWNQTERSRRGSCYSVVEELSSCCYLSWRTKNIQPRVSFRPFKTISGDYSNTLIEKNGNLAGCHLGSGVKYWDTNWNYVQIRETLQLGKYCQVESTPFANLLAIRHFN